MVTATQGRLLQLFAQLLEYPGADLAAAARVCAAELAAVDTAAAALVGRFCRFVEATPRGRLEEIYTSLFDMETPLYPYVGYHLFGETYKRSLFLIGLKERFRAQGFTPAGTELPDHVSTLLRFVATCTDAEMRQELVLEAIRPALEPMVQEAEQEAGPDPAEQPGPAAYRDLLRALLRVLEAAAPAAVASPSATTGGGESGD